MNDRNIEDIIGALYDMVQDARSMPLAADKCILERDRVLDILDAAGSGTGPADAHQGSHL